MSADSVGTWLGVAISVVGFGLALWQIREARLSARRAQSAAEAAVRAAQETRQDIAREELKALIASLRQAARILRDPATPLASTNLLVWIETAAAIVALGAHARVAPTLVAALSQATADDGAVMLAKNAVGKRKSPNPGLRLRAIQQVDGCDGLALVALADLRYT